MSQRLHNGGGPQIPVSLSPLGCVLRGRGEAQDSGISKVMAHFCIEDPNAVTPRPGPREDICAWDSGHGKPNASILPGLKALGPETPVPPYMPHPIPKRKCRAMPSSPGRQAPRGPGEIRQLSPGRVRGWLRVPSHPQSGPTHFLPLPSLGPSHSPACLHTRYLRLYLLSF